MSAVKARLPPEIVRAYGECARAPRPLEDLEAAVRLYLGTLRTQPPVSEFLDLETGRRVVDGCHVLLREVRKRRDHLHHRAVQAAIEYCLLRVDGQDDTSIVGFDDDLQVIRVTAEVLGLSLAEEDG